MARIKPEQNPQPLARLRKLEFLNPCSYSLVVLLDGEKELHTKCKLHFHDVRYVSFESPEFNQLVGRGEIDVKKLASLIFDFHELSQ